MGLDKANHTLAQSIIDRWAIPLGLILLGLVIQLLGDAGREWLRFDRVWLQHGESWRLISGHLAHLGWQHFALNSCGLVLVWYLVGDAFSQRTWLIVIALILAAIDGAFWVLDPELYWYVGLSGLLHGLLVAGLVSRLPAVAGETLVLLLLVTAKIAWEQFAGPVPGSEATSGGPVIVNAHLYGAVGGIIGALVTRIRVPQRASI